VREHESRKVRVLPAAGLAAAEVQVRLPNVMYESATDSVDGDAASDGGPSRRAALNTKLVHAFGSARRCGYLISSRLCKTAVA
jgi:hypothetical protein